MWIVSTLKFLIELWTKQTYACMASVTEPIWFTLSSRQLQARSSAAFSILLGLVTVRSSPTTWIPTWAVRRDQASQSSWSNGSSMDTTGSEKREVCYSSIEGLLVLTSDLIIITNNVIFQITQHNTSPWNYWTISRYHHLSGIKGTLSAALNSVFRLFKVYHIADNSQVFSGQIRWVLQSKKIPTGSETHGTTGYTELFLESKQPLFISLLAPWEFGFVEEDGWMDLITCPLSMTSYRARLTGITSALTDFTI